MMLGRWLLRATAVVATLSAPLPGSGANAAEITVLSAVAMKPALDDLARDFGDRTGHAVKMVYATAGVVKDRIQDGEAVDVVILPRSAFDPLVKQDKIKPGSATIVARSLVAVAVPAGAPKPDVSTVDALRRTLLAAKSIVIPTRRKAVQLEYTPRV
jgi:molybdate transport system substrate-binding protein